MCVVATLFQVYHGCNDHDLVLWSRSLGPSGNRLSVCSSRYKIIFKTTPALPMSTASQWLLFGLRFCQALHLLKENELDVSKYLVIILKSLLIYIKLPAKYISKKIDLDDF